MDLPGELVHWYETNKDTASSADLVRFDRLQMGVCMGWCHEFETPGELFRENTAYVHMLSNYAVLCPDCQVESEAHWASMWSDHFTGIM